MKITPNWLTAARRKRLYRIGGALTAVLMVYGLLSAEQAAVWVSLVGTIVLPAIAQDNV
jgi:hypothetical protein